MASAAAATAGSASAAAYAGPAWETDHKLSALGFGRQYQDPEHPVVRKALEVAQALGARDVLDMAAGRGVTALALAGQDRGRRVLATDIDAAGLKEAAAKADAAALPIRTRVLDAAAPQWPSELEGSFDLVVAKDVYPFLTKRQITRLLRNAAASLRPGGTLVISAPTTKARLYQDSSSRDGSRGYYQRLSQEQRDFVPTTRPAFNFVDARRLKRVLRRAGFDLVSAEEYGRALGWTLAVARRRD